MIAVVLGQPLGRASAYTLRRWLSESGISPDSDCRWLTVVQNRDAKESEIKRYVYETLLSLGAMSDVTAVVVVGRYGVRLDSDLWRGGITRANGHSGQLKMPVPPAYAPIDEADPTTYRRVNAIALSDPYGYTRELQNGNTRRAVEIENASKLILSRVVHMDDPVFLPDVTVKERAFVNGLVGLDTETNEGPGNPPEFLAVYKPLLRRISKTAKVDPRAMTLKMVGISDGQLSFNGVDFGPDAEPICYNSPFDQVVTGNWEARWHDPKMLFHLMGEKDTEMKSLAMRTIGRPLMHYDEVAGGEREGSYCVADATTHKDLLLEGFKRASPGIRNLYETIERPMIRLYSRWTMQGVFALDRAPAQALYDQQIGEIEALRQRIEKLTNGKVTNPDATDQVAAYVFGWSKALNPDDKPSVDVKALSDPKAMRVRGVPEILERRALKKQASTYLGAWLDWPFELLGCIWRGTGAWTGRPSVAALQLHNVPPGLRHFLIPPPGKVLRSFDNSQLEIRVAAHISRDSKMIRLLRGEIPGYEDADVHRWATDLISKAVGRPVSRTFGKIGNFSQLYGGSEAAIYTQAPRFGATMDEVRPVAKLIGDTIKREYREFHAWAHKVENLPRVPGLFGAVLIPPPHPDESYLQRERVNAPIQRGAVDIVKLQTLALEAAGFHCVHQIHDEVIVELDERDDTEDVRRQIASIMESAVTLDVPLRADTKLWGKAA